MTSSFPIKYVNREDPEFQKLPWYQFVLKPGKQGSTVNDYLCASNALWAALESKELSESDPDSLANGRELTLEVLKDVVADRISKNDLDWVRGCDSIQIRHHPVKHEKLTSILSHLPVSTDYRKLLSVHHKEETFVFKVDLLENEYMIQDSFVVNLFNEMEPPAVRLAEKGRIDGFRFSHLYGSNTILW